MRSMSSGVGGQGCARLRALESIVDAMERHKRLPEGVGGGQRRRDTAVVDGCRALPGATPASGLSGDRERDG